MPTTQGRIYLGSIPVAGGLLLDADAQSYITAIEGDGVTVTDTQKAALSDFVVTGKDGGWYSELKRLYLPIWGVAAANARCLVSATSGTFVGGVTHSAGYVENDGSTGYFLANTDFVSLGCSASTGYFAGLFKTASGFNLFGAGTGSSYTRLFYSAGSISARWTVAGVGSVSGTASPTGIISFSREGGDRSIYRRASGGRTTVVQTTGADGGSAPISNIAMLGTWNSSNFAPPSLTPSIAASGQCGAWALGEGLSDAMDSSFSADLQALWETVTGLSLP